ncbi:MAG: DUF4890 domain-containing protein [Prevotella sp.]|nr:DUF4890 domain-containing protein [Prevotella sp.]
MKSRLMALMAMVMISTVAMAQNQGNRQGRNFDPKEFVKQQTSRMAERYGLDAAQQEKLEALNTEYAGKLRPMGGPGRGPRGEAGPRRQAPDGVSQATPPAEGNANGARQGQRPSKEEMEARMKERQAAQDAYNNSLKEILTEEQFAKYTEDQKQVRQRGPRNGQRPQRNQ